MKLKLASKHIPLLATAVVLVALYAAGCLSYRNFGSLAVFVNLLNDNAFLGVAAVGATFVILSGGIDLSVGSVIAFTGIFIAKLISLGVDPVVTMLLALVLGVLFGAAMGSLIHFFDLPPFLVTLGGMFFARGMGFVIHEQSLGIKHAFYSQTITETLAIPLTHRVSLPFTAICFIVITLVAAYMALFTRFGRNVYAVGSSESSARLMGVPIGQTKVLIYAFAGFCSALGGCVMTFYMQSGNPASFVGLELDAIAAVVIGGTLLTGGVGYIWGTVMGVLILGLIQTIITFQGNLNTWWTKIVIGLLLLVFIVLQRFLSRKAR
jgi:galactofuranose transport system permease protein